MTSEQENAVVDAMALIIARHEWLSAAEWRACSERAVAAYFEHDDVVDDAAQMGPNATRRAAEGLAAALKGLQS